jgi:hypothetical protein
MSIPISCAGCGSAFDVPDNLAGKMIRCTACKAQMTVPEEIPAAVIEEPAAQPAGSGETKKPFGSGAQKAAAPSPSRAGGSTAGKTPPNGPAAPAKSAASAKAETQTTAKAVTKAMDLDDDEDEKPTKSKPAKAAEKKIPARRRRDDDDDDDDEDEKPTRKKKKPEGGGNGKVIAAGGGGVGTIVLIVVIIILRVARHQDRDHSPRDSANNTVNNATTNTGTNPPATNSSANTGTNPAANPNPATPNPGNTPADPAMPAGTGPLSSINPNPNPSPATPADPNPATPADPAQPVPAQPLPAQPVPAQPVGGQPLPGQPLPGQPIPGQPVPGQPMPGQPFAGQPPAFGPPGATNGNQKARLDAFLTAAFDLDKKDLFTVELRQGPRGSAGTLHRYTYPDFSGDSSYHLSHIGFRSVIDPKAGLLYVAYATTLTAFTEGTPQDRITAVGSVAVYDLNAIREKKTADGKPLADGADLKPVATITLASRIHGMELSEDGKSLYVLVTPTGKKTGSLWLIDTEKRSIAKRAELGEPVRDLVKSSDGKSLLVLESDPVKGKYGVSFFDPKEWNKVKTTSIPKAMPIDVAPMADGSMLVSAVTFSQPGTVAGFGTSVQVQQMTYKLFRVNKDGQENGSLDLGPERHVTNAGYAKFDPTGKVLFTSSHRSGNGLDVYEVKDPNAANGFKLKTAILTAKNSAFGGHFFVTPDGKYLVFQQGAVIDTADVGGVLVAGPAPPAQPAPPPPAGMNPAP